MIYSLISLICLSYVGLWFLYFLYSGVFKYAKKPVERFLFFKSFKHGQFTLIYPSAIPLFFLARFYQTGNVIESLLKSVKDTVAALVLDLDFDAVKDLFYSNDFYRIAYIACIVAIFFNTVLFLFTVFYQTTANWLRVLWRTHLARKLNVVVGALDQNRQLIEALVKGEQVLYLSKFTPEERDWLFAHGVAYRPFEKPEELADFAGRRKLKRRHIRVIINTGDDVQNLLYTDAIAELIAAQGSPQFVLENKYGIDAYVFGAQKNCSSFARYVEKTKGRVHYKDRYFMIAYDFESRYPLTNFMDETHLNYEKGTLRPDVDVNVAMIGFGKVSRQLFLTSVANNQFISEDGAGNPYSRKVSYYLYDKDLDDEKNLNHTYYRYETEILEGKIDRSLYYPLPEKPALTVPRKGNINDKGFYDKLHADLIAKEGKRAFNYLIVSYGEDLENLDLAAKLYAKLLEWGLLDCTYLFLRVRNHELASNVIAGDFGDGKHVFCFGDEREAIYNVSHIVNEANERMARHRHYTYTAEKDTTRTEEQISKAAGEKWFDGYDETKRRSNLYGCLNLRFKLQLMGYDCVPKAEKGEDAAKSYYADYEKNDPIDYGEVEKTVNKKRIVTYSNAAIKPGSLRYNLAFQEHARWNAYMITEGYIPAPISSVAAYGGNCVEQRMHCNITTFEGLVAFRKEAAKHEKDPARQNEEAQDVIRYDYHLLDDAEWLLNAGDKKIISRKAAKAEGAEQK